MDKTMTNNEKKFMDTLIDVIRDKKDLSFGLIMLFMMFGAEVATKLFDEDESKEVN